MNQRSILLCFLLFFLVGCGNQNQDEQKKSIVLNTTYDREIEISQETKMLWGKELGQSDLSAGPFYITQPYSQALLILGRSNHSGYIDGFGNKVEGWSSKQIALGHPSGVDSISLIELYLDSEYSTKRGIKVGDPVGLVQKAYGYKELDDQNLLVYSCSLGKNAGGAVTFEIKDGKVYHISINFVRTD